MTALTMIAPMLLLIMRPARGFLIRSFSGMMGRSTKVSTQMKRGKQMPKITRDTITIGWDHG